MPSRSPAVQPRQFEFIALHRLFLGQTIHQHGQFLQTEGFHDGLSAHICGQRKQPLQRLIDQLNAAGGIQNQHAFRHAVEQGRLLCLCLSDDLVMLNAQGFRCALLIQPLFLDTFVATPPPEM